MKKKVLNICLVITLTLSVFVPVKKVNAADYVTNIYQTAATTNSATINWEPVNGALYYQVELGAEDASTNWQWVTRQVLAQTTTGTGFVFHNLTADWISLNQDAKINIRTAIRNNRTGDVMLRDASANFRISDLKLTPGAASVTISDSMSSIEIFYLKHDIPRFADNIEWRIYNAKGRLVNSGIGNSYSDTRISGMKHKDGICTIRVAAYNELNGRRNYGPWTTKLITWNDYTVRKIANKSGQIKIKWKKIAGAKKYTVYGSNNYGKKFKKLGTTKKNKAVVLKIGRKKIKKYKTYVFKIVPESKSRYPMMRLW